MYKIRALTLHLDIVRKFNSLEKFLEYSFFYLNELDDIANNFPKRIKILSKRLVLPSFEKLQKYVNGFNVFKIIDIEERIKEYVDFFNIPIGNPKTQIDYLSNLPHIFAETEKFYTSLRIDEPPIFPDHYGLAIDLLKRISEIGGWNAPTRFAFSFGPQPLTPYFPVTHASTTGYSISLLYINDLVSALSNKQNLKTISFRLEEILNEVTTMATEVKKKFKLLFSGVDLSLSPWLEESVVPLIETFKENLTIGTVGSLNILYKINVALQKFGNRIHTTGFNEIMLPLAEDNGLKMRVRENDLSFKDFLTFCFVCAAGLDMIPIPIWTAPKLLSSLLYDLRTIYKVKKRTIGVRLIPVDAEPGEEIELREFGKTPVLDILK